MWGWEMGSEGEREREREQERYPNRQTTVSLYHCITVSLHANLRSEELFAGGAEVFRCPLTKRTRKAGPKSIRKDPRTVAIPTICAGTLHHSRILAENQRMPRRKQQRNWWLLWNAPIKATNEMKICGL